MQVTSLSSKSAERLQDAARSAHATLSADGHTELVKELPAEIVTNRA
jgi:hypothetical protein